MLPNSRKTECPYIFYELGMRAIGWVSIRHACLLQSQLSETTSRLFELNKLFGVYKPWFDAAMWRYVVNYFGLGFTRATS